MAVASEHDERAGTERGPDTIFVFSLDGVRVARFGDFGQRELRDEQAEAIGEVDLLFVPAGGGPTIGAFLDATGDAVRLDGTTFDTGDVEGGTSCRPPPSGRSAAAAARCRRPRCSRRPSPCSR